jgi:hypothetical protein
MEGIRNAGSGDRLLWAMADALAACGAHRAALAHFEAAMESGPALPEGLEQLRATSAASLRADGSSRPRLRRRRHAALSTSRQPAL